MYELSLFIGIVVVYGIYKIYPQYSTTKRSEKLEDLADQYFHECIQQENKIIKEYTEKIKEKYLLFNVEEIIKKSELKLKQLENVQEMYLRLKEKNKFASNEEKFNVLQDWFDYTCAARDINSAFQMLDYDFSDQAYDNYIDRIKEPGIIMHEIEIRFKNLLKDRYK